MNEKISLQSSLIDVDDSVLVMIDVQESFLEKFPIEEHALLANRIGWLVGVAVKLNVPIVAMAENLPHLGGVAPQVAERLPTGIHVHNKMIFGLADNPEILAAVKSTGRKTTVLVGLETDVCVAHSALGLLQNGFRVVAVADATGSPGSAHVVGLERMRRAGVLITSVKSLYYEWIRTVERAIEFGESYIKEIGLPKDLEL
jgi:nicotinamidase-related amidase